MESQKHTEIGKDFLKAMMKHNGCHKTGIFLCVWHYAATGRNGNRHRYGM